MKFLKVTTNDGKVYKDCYFKTKTINPYDQYEHEELHISLYSKSEGFLAEVTCLGIGDTGNKIAYVCIDPSRNIDVMNILSNHCLATSVSVPMIYYGREYIKVVFDLNRVAEFSEIE